MKTNVPDTHPDMTDEESNARAPLALAHIRKLYRRGLEFRPDSCGMSADWPKEGCTDNGAHVQDAGTDTSDQPDESANIRKRVKAGRQIHHNDQH